MSEPTATTEREKPDECDSCHYETTALSRYERDRISRYWKQDKWLCSLCSHTATGNALSYPEQFPNADVMRIVCYVGNTILDAIKKQEPKG